LVERVKVRGLRIRVQVGLTEGDGKSVSYTKVFLTRGEGKGVIGYSEKGVGKERGRREGLKGEGVPWGKRGLVPRGVSRGTGGGGKVSVYNFFGFI